MSEPNDHGSGEVVSLPGVKLSPEVLMHRTLANVGKIKAIALVVMWDDDTMDTGWSSARVSELCMMGMLLHDDVLRNARGLGGGGNSEGKSA